MNKLRQTAIVLLVVILSLLLIATTTGTGSGQASLDGENTAKATSVDVAGWEQNPILVDTGAWQIHISGGDISSVSWRETPEAIVITITGIVPNGNDVATSTY